MNLLLFANTDWYLYNFRRGLAFALRDAGHEVLLVSPPGPYGERLRALGFRWEPAPMDRRSLNPLRESALLLWLRRLMVAERVDLVHGFTIKCAVYGSLAARLAGVPARVNSVTGLGYVFSSSDAKARVLRPLVRGLLRLALGGGELLHPRNKGQAGAAPVGGARLILQNPDDRALFVRERLVAREMIRLIAGSGVDCERFAPPVDAVAARASSAFRVLLPARLLWDKGLAELVAAARLLRAEGRAIHVLLAGDPDPGNPAAVPDAILRGWVEEGLVDWLGHVDEMPELFRSVDAVVLPSYREGLPKGLIEAAACGLALVTTDVPGCREVVTDGVDGLLVPVKDARALAGAIARLQDDPGLCRRLGAAAREKAFAEFDERIVIRRTIEVYDELV